MRLSCFTVHILTQRGVKFGSDLDRLSFCRLILPLLRCAECPLGHWSPVARRWRNPAQASGAQALGTRAFRWTFGARVPGRRFRDTRCIPIDDSQGSLGALPQSLPVSSGRSPNASEPRWPSLPCAPLNVAARPGSASPHPSSGASQSLHPRSRRRRSQVREGPAR